MLWSSSSNREPPSILSYPPSIPIPVWSVTFTYKLISQKSHLVSSRPSMKLSSKSTKKVIAIILSPFISILRLYTTPLLLLLLPARAFVFTPLLCLNVCWSIYPLDRNSSSNINPTCVVFRTFVAAISLLLLRSPLKRAGDHTRDAHRNALTLAHRKHGDPIQVEVGNKQGVYLSLDGGDT
ncbi:hypothetical protein PENSPDRAFT_184923 [Peniophora sp. CONT]|nr:hypothetical protein PENSPDRAFT_184923 [Peniophora sp. CONT]